MAAVVVAVLAGCVAAASQAMHLPGPAELTDHPELRVWRGEAQPRWWGAERRAADKVCQLWRCECQGLSDRYGAWHYKGFASSTRLAEAWWMNFKCHHAPRPGSNGWRVTRLLSRWEFGTRYVPELQRRVAALRLMEARGEANPGALSRNEAMLGAIRNDTECFVDPAWPRLGKVCGGRETSEMVRRFVKFYLGFAGELDYDLPRPAPDPPLLQPPRRAGDAISVEYTVRGWFGGGLSPETHGGDGATGSAEAAEIASLIREGRAQFLPTAAKLTLGRGALPFGLEEALSTLPVGRETVVAIPPAAAYGDAGLQSGSSAFRIPGGAHIVVQAKVLEAHSSGPS